MASPISAAAADLAGGDGEVGGLADQSVRGRVDQPVAIDGGGAAGGQNLGAESRSSKRKAGLMSKSSASPVWNGAYLEVAYEDSYGIKKEIEDLRSELDGDVKELGYCEENEKLRDELALKTKEMQCLRKQNEELQAKNVGLVKQNEDLQAKNDVVVKRNGELQAKNNGLVKQNEDLQATNDGVVKQNEELRSKNNCLVKQNEELQTKNDIMREQNGELQAKNGGLSYQNGEMRAKNDDLMKQIGELQANNDGLVKQNEDLQAKNDVLVKRNCELQAKNDGLVKQNEDLQAKSDGVMKQKEELQSKNNGLVKRSEELQTKNDIMMEETGGLSYLNEEMRAKNDDLTKQNGELQAKNDGLWKLNEKVKAKNDSLTNQIDEQNDGRMNLTEAISNFNDEVTKLITTVNQLMAKNRTLVDTEEVLEEEYDAVNEEVAAYASELKGTRKKNKDLSGDIFKEKRNLGAEPGSRKRKAAAVSKSLTSSVGNGDQETEMAQETLEDESCFSVDMLSLALYKYFETNKELIEARRELLWVFEDRAFIRSSTIGIKRMDELAQQPFIDACRRKPVNNSDDEAANLVSIWQEQLKDPSWHPFKIVEVNGQTKQVVDAKLRALWMEYGDDVCEAVKTAVTEINEHNPSGAYVVWELWHLGEGRKATVSEALRELVRQLRRCKRRCRPN
ncbi:hypothetical protein BS78_03G065800 [Paspalum vaginatum]|nr:hypothetical protein BS78_03G065800 [Paspalum vaginatum]